MLTVYCMAVMTQWNLLVLFSIAKFGSGYLTIY